MEAFYAVLPVFLLIAVGAAVHMTDVLPENTGAAMGLYVLKLALPVLMLHILAGASRLDLAHGGFWLGVIGAQMLCYLLGYVVDRLFSRRGTGPAIISGLACSASNTAFVGLPIVASLLPGNHEAMVVAGLAALTPNVVVIMAQVRMDCLAGSAAWGDGRGRIWKLLRLFLLGNPCCWPPWRAWPWPARGWGCGGLWTMRRRSSAVRPRPACCWPWASTCARSWCWPCVATAGTR